jgi:hypothetical protein
MTLRSDTRKETRSGKVVPRGRRVVWPARSVLEVCEKKEMEQMPATMRWMIGGRG